ncbi:hypothetical protein B0T24DRAFT_641730, partial [Lasiosphaeria ovina]
MVGGKEGKFLHINPNQPVTEPKTKPLVSLTQTIPVSRMSTAPGRYSTTVGSLRLYVYIRITQRPAVVEVEFPKAEVVLAERYRESISGTKRLLPANHKLHVVAFELPRSVIELETNKSLRAFLLHFDTTSDAAKFEDAICFTVKDHPRQVFIKQYWDPAEVVVLEERLPKLVPAVVEWPRPPERAGTPPGEARGSPPIEYYAKENRVRR